MLVTLSGFYTSELHRLRMLEALKAMKRDIPGFPATAYVLTHPYTNTTTITVPAVPWVPAELDRHHRYFTAFPHGEQEWWRTGAESVRDFTIP